jgi:tRNA A58 N-methylase Trm61
MATDIEQILSNLTSFYDFNGKRVIHVGAGGGQLIGYAAATAHVWAVDSEAEAVQALRERIGREKLSSKVDIIEGDFYGLSFDVDVVLFEFCLHEMKDPLVALNRAKTMAGDVVVIDHKEDSAWAWYVCETEKAAASWKAVRKSELVTCRDFEAAQYFADYKELYDKVSVIGPKGVRRIDKYQGAMDIEITMSYQLALIGGISRSPK